jgi:hypothetical protein
VEIEYEMFKTFHPNAQTLPIPSPGGAALHLAERLGGFSEEQLHDVDFAALFHRALNQAAGDGGEGG